MNATKHVVSSPVTFSDAGSTPAASTIPLSNFVVDLSDTKPKSANSLIEDNSEKISESNSEFLKSDLRATDNFPQLSSRRSITRIPGLRIYDGTVNNSEF